MNLKLLLFVTFAVAAGGEMSVQRAVEVVRKGISAQDADPHQSWEASRSLLAVSRSQPTTLAPYKDIIVREIRNLDKWDSFTELTGTYKLNLIKSLFGLGDPDLTDLFISECGHGIFVAEGLARIGEPAVEPLLERLDGPFATCALASLTRIAQDWIEIGSAPAAEKADLRRKFQRRVVPAIQARIDSLASEATGNPVALRKAREALDRISDALATHRER